MKKNHKIWPKCRGLRWNRDLHMIEATQKLKLKFIKHLSVQVERNFHRPVKNGMALQESDGISNAWQNWCRMAWHFKCMRKDCCHISQKNTQEMYVYIQSAPESKNTKSKNQLHEHNDNDNRKKKNLYSGPILQHLISTQHQSSNLVAMNETVKRPSTYRGRSE
jgi:hypothetical protein